MVIDAAEPHISRIYDYVLGGTYNNEADRRAAEAMIARMPAYPRWARANRAFLGRVGDRWAAEGRARVLDLGSGLPTQGHFNTRLPAARLLFADIDPLTVAQGRQLLADATDAAYVQADVRDPDALLAEADAFFGGARDLAVGCIGLLYFLSDEQLRRLMERLHAFCAPGSTVALSFPAIEGPPTEALLEVNRELSRVARIDFFPRTVEQVGELVAPWRVVAVERLEPPLTAEARAEHPMSCYEMVGLFAERV